MITEKIRILVVEDEVLVAEDLKEILRGFGFEVPGIAETGEGAITLAGETRPDLILMDINLSGAMDGILAGGRSARDGASRSSMLRRLPTRHSLTGRKRPDPQATS